MSQGNMLNIKKHLLSETCHFDCWGQYLHWFDESQVDKVDKLDNKTSVNINDLLGISTSLPMIIKRNGKL